MTKGELIKKLEQFPDDLNVVIFNEDIGLFYEVQDTEKKGFKHKGESNNKSFEAIVIW